MNRPNYPQSRLSTERVTHTLTGRQIWRQVGWHGQSGDFYSLAEPLDVIHRAERGGYSPLWLLVEDEPYPVEGPSID